MKTWLCVVIGVLAFSTWSTAATGLRFGRISYTGELSDDCAGEASTAPLYGITYYVRALPAIDIGFGFEYAKSDFTGSCDHIKASAELGHFGVEVSGTFAVFTAAVTELYAGGGLSGNWFQVSGLDCCTVDKNRLGYHGLIGVAAAAPGFPLRGYLESRLGRITGSPDITTTSVYLGIELGL